MVPTARAVLCYRGVVFAERSPRRNRTRAPRCHPEHTMPFIGDPRTRTTATTAPPVTIALRDAGAVAPQRLFALLSRSNEIIPSTPGAGTAWKRGHEGAGSVRVR